MASNFKPHMGLVQKPTQIQTLVLTQKLQQAIGLLQLSTLELSQKIDTEMAENPLLEEVAAGETEGDGVSERGNDELTDGVPDVSNEPLNDPVRQEVAWAEYFSGQHSGRTVNSREEGAAPSFENIVSGKTDLRSHLLWQLNMTNLDEEQREIADYIVGNLDENGYLDIEFDDMVQALGCSEEKVR